MADEDFRLAVLEVLEAVPKDDLWEQGKLEKRLRDYFRKAARGLDFGSKPWYSLINEFADCAFSSMFQALGDRQWLAKADFVLCLDAAVRDSFPPQLFKGVDKADFERVVLYANDRAFEEQRYLPILWGLIREQLLPGGKSQKKVYDALDHGRQLAAKSGYPTEDPNQVKVFISRWADAAMAHLSRSTQGEPSSVLPEAAAVKLFHSLLRGGALPLPLSTEYGLPPKGWPFVDYAVHAAFVAWERGHPAVAEAKAMPKPRQREESPVDHVKAQQNPDNSKAKEAEDGVGSEEAGPNIGVKGELNCPVNEDGVQSNAVGPNIAAKGKPNCELGKDGVPGKAVGPNIAAQGKPSCELSKDGVQGKEVGPNIAAQAKPSSELSKAFQLQACSQDGVQGKAVGPTIEAQGKPSSELSKAFQLQACSQGGVQGKAVGPIIAAQGKPISELSKDGVPRKAVGPNCAAPGKPNCELGKDGVQGKAVGPNFAARKPTCELSKDGVQGKAVGPNIAAQGKLNCELSKDGERSKEAGLNIGAKGDVNCQLNEAKEVLKAVKRVAAPKVNLLPQGWRWPCAEEELGSDELESPSKRPKTEEWPEEWPEDW